MSVKDEAPYILEWVAYYLSIGATDLSIFHNDCTDGTADMLARLQALGIARVYDNPLGVGGGRNSAQRLALDQLQTNPDVRAADWFMFLDIDEFVNVKCGARDLDSLIDHIGGDADAISMNWRMIGSTGHLTFVDRPVTERFFAVGGQRVGAKEREIKTLFRPGRFDVWRAHRPAARVASAGAGSAPRWVNGSGAAVGAAFLKDAYAAALPPTDVGRACVQINHYAVRSREEFVRLRMRGSGLNNHGRFDWSYWWKSEVSGGGEDRSIPTERMRPILTGLMEDPTLAGLHSRAVEIHRARVAQERRDPEVAAFLDGEDPPISKLEKAAPAHVAAPTLAPSNSPAPGAGLPAVALPECPPLTFPREVANVVREAYADAAVILEYGSGGSTVLASELPDKTILAVESDKGWAERMRAYFAAAPSTLSVPVIHYADIGTTAAWGSPKGNRAFRRYSDYPVDVWDRDEFLPPDVVLIDGRFRVACFFTVMLRATQPTTVLFDDYTPRPAYHLVEQFFRPVRIVGRMAVFEVPPMTSFPREALKTIVSAYARQL